MMGYHNDIWCQDNLISWLHPARVLTLEEKSNDIIKYNYASDTVIRGNMLSVLFQHPEIKH